MMELLQSTTGFSFWFFLKIAVIVLMLLYLAFAVVMVRQVKLMTQTLKVGFEKPVVFIAYIHLAFTVVVFVLSLVVL